MTRKLRYRLAMAELAVAALLVVGCAAPGTTSGYRVGQRNDDLASSPRIQTHFWRLNELAGSDLPTISLQAPSGVHARLETRQIRTIVAVGNRLLRADGDDIQVDLVVLASYGINAYAFYQGEQPTIGFTLGMVRLLASDQDAWAALLGHELAHIRLAHVEEQQDRRGRSEVTSSLAGLVLSAIGLPFANVAADAATLLADRAYSRDDEREADRIGLAYMRNAGFAAEGAITLQQLLLGASNSVSLPFLGTHPSGEERITALRELIQHGK